jgi:hypothetical protein
MGDSEMINRLAPAPAVLVLMLVVWVAMWAGFVLILSGKPDRDVPRRWFLAITVLTLVTGVVALYGRAPL